MKIEIEKIDNAIKTYTEKNNKTSELAKKALTESGIYHIDGKLSKEYGGENK